MKTVEQILSAKGYDNDQIQHIVYENPNFDEKVRSKYGISEPIHLWEAYYIGDADPETMDDIAISKDYDNYVELLADMDRELIYLAEDYPEKDLEI